MLEKSRAYDRALAYAELTGDHNLEGQILGLKAILLSRQGDLKAATLTADKALSYASASNQDEVLVQTLINAGFLFSEAGEIGKSIQLFQRGCPSL